MKAKHQLFVTLMFVLVFSSIEVTPAYTASSSTSGNPSLSNEQGLLSNLSNTPPSSPAAAGNCGNLVVDSGSGDAGKSINGYLNDQYIWYDSACLPRSAALARNDNSKGGNAKQFTYMINGSTTRTVNPGANGAGGFGYIVAHLSNPSFANSYGADDSPLGSGNSATYDKLFTGENHAIHEYTLNYVRYGLTQQAITDGFEPWTWINDALDPNRQYVTVYNMPVRIQWMFATGRDYPVWSVTFDLSAAPDHAIDSDFRAPYGDMNIEGGNGAELVDGVAWGDSYRFTTLGSPFTMDNEWDYSQLNPGAPYDYLWTANVDAEMGLAGTQIIALQNAGGYNNYLAPVWRGHTSANMGQICMNDEGAGPAYDHTMPCTSDWAYQLIQYSVALANETTNNKRLAWGADWGSLGNSLLPQTDTSNGYDIVGYPKVSYSVYIVLDPHSKNPTQGMALQAKTVSLTTLTASVGSVRTSGPAGVGRNDNATYSPAGYSPIFGTWEVNAANNSANLTFTVSNLAPSTLDSPIIVLHNYTGSVASTQISMDGVTLASGSDYFASVRSASSELWVTLNKKLSGTHNIQISSSSVSSTFSDVPSSYWASSFIERLYAAGITGGCATSPNLLYCPDNPVTRAQMAVFLLKGMHSSSFTPPAVGASTGFTDVATGYWAAAWIKQLAAEGITGGCGSGIYCPDTNVTRAQMAIFLLRAKHGSSYVPPNATGIFTDVPLGYWADKWIEQLAAEGITGGCGTGIYCPDSDVTRAQMAVFLVRAFNLP
ncbi:MAG TPA: S-layer homology domain-containing protein [Anaerolineales bacterium]|nr:S-layer homology domain-containing protein [Anaerolineales bacterium]